MGATTVTTVSVSSEASLCVFEIDNRAALSITRRTGDCTVLRGEDNNMKGNQEWVGIRRANQLSFHRQSSGVGSVAPPRPLEQATSFKFRFGAKKREWVKHQDRASEANTQCLLPIHHRLTINE